MADKESRDDYYNAPILVGDAASMLRRHVQKNDRPYVSDTTKLNNRLVDQWKKDVLVRMADHRGMLPSGRVWQSWQLFDEGRSIKKFIELKEQGMLPDPPAEVIEFWKEFFETLTVSEMHEYGSGTISAGWSILQTHITRWFADKKWELLFSKKPDDPLWWEKNYHSHTAYLNGEVLPFWNGEELKDVQQKVSAVLMNQVQPQQMTGFH